MDPNHVLTARGFLLNMYELKLKSLRPLIDNSNVDQKDKVKPQQRPVAQLNVRGFMPSLSGVAKPPAIAQEPVKEIEIDPTGPTLADLTGITVDSPRYLKQRPANAIQTANETLREIIGDLDQFKDRDTANTQDARRSDEKRRSKKA